MLDCIYVLMENKKNELNDEIEIPNGISAYIHDKTLVTRKDNNEIRRRLNARIAVDIKGNKIILSSKKFSRKEKKIFGSFKAHIRNMIKGLEDKFKYQLQVVAVHFPITVSHDKNTNELVIKNFLGEKKDRRIKIIPGIDVKVNKDIIDIESVDIEKAGQMASNIEKGTKVRKKDRRIFQDGVFIIKKPGRSYL